MSDTALPILELKGLTKQFEFNGDRILSLIHI